LQTPDPSTTLAPQVHGEGPDSHDSGDEMNSVPQPEAVAIRRQLRAVLSASWLVAVAVLVLGGLAYFRAERQADVYAGRAVVRVFNATAPTLGGGGAARVDPLREVQTQASYMTSEAVRLGVEQRLGARARRIEAVRVSPVANSDLLAVQVESRLPSVAQEGAQAYAEVYVESRRASILQSLGARAEELRAHAARIQGEINAIDQRITQLVPPPQIDPRTGRAVVLPDSEQVASLRTQREGLIERLTGANNVADELSVEASIRQANLEVVDPADRPTDPVRPVPLRDAAVGGAVGLFAGVAVALLRERANDRLRNVEDMDQAARPLPVLALVPVDKTIERAGRKAFRHPGQDSAPLAIVATDPTAPAAEAYRTLVVTMPMAPGRAGPRGFREAFGLSEPDGSTRSVLVTSSIPGEGKTTTAANLALTLARAGSRVLLVDADLRAPSVHRLFALENHKGLTSVLRGRLLPEDARVSIEVPGAGSLDVLAAGPSDSVAREMLASGSADVWLEDMQRSYDHLVVDSGPILPGADPLALARVTDATLLVARMGTRRRDLQMAQQRLEQVSGSVVGLVLNAVPPRNASYYYYDGRSPRDRAPKQRSPEPTSPSRQTSTAERRTLTAAASSRARRGAPNADIPASDVLASVGHAARLGVGRLMSAWARRLLRPPPVSGQRRRADKAKRTRSAQLREVPPEP
jgi:capsular exopolysaccharide synthesis family protein